MFPEGTRTEDGRIAPLKPGFGLLCRKTGATIVPVLVDGAYECWPRHKRFPSSGTIVVCFGQAIPAEQIKEMDDRELAELLTDKLRQMQNQCRLKLGKNPYEY